MARDADNDPGNRKNEQNFTHRRIFKKILCLQQSEIWAQTATSKMWFRTSQNLYLRRAAKISEMRLKARLNPPTSRMDPGGRLYSLQNLKYFFPRFAREVIFFTKPQNFLPRFAREVIFFTKSSIFFALRAGRLYFLQNQPPKSIVFWTFFGPFPP